MALAAYLPHIPTRSSLIIDASETQRSVLVDADYVIRDGVTAESLAKLKSACGQDLGRMV
jgi:hypothetical protein